RRNRYYPHAPLCRRSSHRCHVSPRLQAPHRRCRPDGGRGVSEYRIGCDTSRGISENTVVRTKPRLSHYEDHHGEYGFSLSLPAADQRRPTTHAKGRPGLFPDRSSRNHAAVSGCRGAGGIGMRPALEASTTPILLSFEELQTHWHRLNVRYFAGSLPPIAIRWSRRLTSSVGMFASRGGPKTWYRAGNRNRRE